MIRTFGILAALFLVPGAFAANEVAGRAVSTSGLVMIFNPNTNPIVKRTLKKGDTVLAGETIETGADGQVKLLFLDKSLMDLVPNSVFVVDEFIQNDGINRKVQVTVKKGTLRSVINKAVGEKGHFRFKTSGTTMGVRGTELLVEAVPQGTGQRESLTVLSGRVELQTVNASGGFSQPQLVTQGQSFQADSQTSTTGRTQVTGGRLVQVPADVLRKKGEDSKVRDNTFENAVKIGSSDGDKRDSLSALGETFASVRNTRPTEVGDLKIPGMFGRDFIRQHQQNFSTIGRPIRVNVGFVR